MEPEAALVQGNNPRHLARWRTRLLPFMIGMVTALAGFFFVASCVQLIYLHKAIQNAPTFQIEESLNQLTPTAQTQPETALAVSRFALLAKLEAYSLLRHYHQTNISLLQRVWTQFLGFVTGMILALVGATFILGQLQTAASQVKAETPALKLNLDTTSPGLILAGLGAALMICTVTINHRIQSTDAAVYLRDATATLSSETSRPPTPYPPSVPSAQNSLNTKPLERK
jgi:hypothetical protein